jgi:glycosyltransferase involved in cell wall biosynthesis
MHLFNSFEVGGVERQHMMLVERLASHYEQICWSFFHGPIEGELDALGVTYSTGDFSVLRSMLEQNEFDCAIIRTNRFSREVAAYFTASPTPVVYIRSFLRWYEGNDTHFDEAFEKLSYAYPDHIFFSGPSLRDSALRLGMHIPGGEVLYNGVDMSRFSATPRVPSFSGRPFRVGMLANIAPHKNQLAAIEALKPELESGGCTLIMGGEEQYPDYARQVRNAARNLPVEFLGYVARPETFFADVDVLLLASTREGWPTVLMEAMAAGLPCIAPDIGDISRLLGNGEFGMLYADGDFACIPRLVARLRRVEHYVHYAKQAHLRGLDFDIERTSRTLHRAIQGVMAKVNAYAIC